MIFIIRAIELGSFTYRKDKMVSASYYIALLLTTITKMKNTYVLDFCHKQCFQYFTMNKKLTCSIKGSLKFYKKRSAVDYFFNFIFYSGFDTFILVHIY